MFGHLALFAGGVLFGTAGFKVLGSRDAKNVYSHVTAAALRGKDCVMECVDKVRENAEDVLDAAKEINEERAAEEELIEDEAETEASDKPARKRSTGKRAKKKE